MSYLTVHSDVDDRVVANARLGKQRGQHGHCWANERRITKLLDQRKYRIWCPGNHKCGYHNTHHEGDTLFATIPFSHSHRTLQ